MQCAFFRTPLVLIIGIACLAIASFICSLLASRVLLAISEDGVFELYYASLFMNIIIVVTMTAAFLRPLWDVGKRSKTLRSVVLRTGIGGLVHLFSYLGFFVFESIWLTESECSNSALSYFEQFMILFLQAVPLQIHLCLSHRDDLVLLAALRYWLAAAKARFVRGTSQNDGYASQSKWHQLDEKERAEVRRLNGNGSDRTEGGDSAAEAETEAHVEMETANPIHPNTGDFRLNALHG